MRIIHLLFLIIICFSPASQAQIVGVVSAAESEEPLPFASVYDASTGQGTTTNSEGYFELPLDPGTYQLTFQYVGYRTATKEIEHGLGKTQVSISLEEDAILLQQIEVKANAEDPAYAIIRKAIAKRKYYRDLVKAYECNVYIKGKIKVLDAPEQILGQEVGDLGGTLDSTRQGILYLSESKSTVYAQEPNDFKEVLEQSKVSGDDTGFSFNSANDMDFDFYEDYSDYGRQIISPIAGNALSYYEYKLLGTLYDEAGRLINKIQVIPKRSEDPVYRGYIYIVEDLWNIQTVDLVLTGTAMSQPALDTLRIRQVHVPVQEPDVWRIFSQSYDLVGGIFGFRFGGNFTGVYTNYNLAPQFPKNFFTNEIFRVEEGANETGTVYFDSLRPIPLTEEESIDYVRKDSIQKVVRSEVYLDSIDRVNNKFTPANLLLGYTYSRSYEQWSLSIGSPLSTLQFNTVQGFLGYSDLRFRKELNKEGTRWFRVGTRLMYGLSDQVFRAEGRFQFHFNRINYTQIELKGGTAVEQFNDNRPIRSGLNELYSLYFKRNYMKLYDLKYVQFDFKREWINGLYGIIGLSWEERSPLMNNSDQAFANRDRTYFTNNPTDFNAPADFFPTHRGLIARADFRIRIGQKYISYPYRRFFLDTKWPDIWLRYRKGIPIAQASGEGISELDYDHLQLEIVDRGIDIGLVGELDYRLVAGAFLRNETSYFMDFQHFNGNQTLFSNPFRYLSTYQLLPYYDYSTDQQYFQAHLQHHFNGYILDKIPGIRKLHFSTVLGARMLAVQDQPNYYELSFGIDQIGWKLFRLLRVDGVVAFQDNQYYDWGIIIGLKLPTN